MLLLYLLALISAVSSASTENRNRCWSAGNGKVAQYWQEGERIDRGKFWYECRNQELKPRGCFTNENRRINVNENYVHHGYEIRCTLGSDGFLKFDYTACLPEGYGRYEEGQTWEDKRQMYYFECKKDGPYLRITIVGCLTHDKVGKLKLDEAYDDGDFVYECKKKSNGNIQMCSAGCVHDGKRYKIGESWPDGDFVYYCKIENGRCKKICIGCKFNEKRLSDGDRYTKGGTIYQCEIRQNDQQHRAVGCSVRDKRGDTIERVIGCKWFDETMDSKIEKTCAKDGTKAEVKSLGCVYVHKGYDVLFLEPGTYTIWTESMDKPPIAVACKEISDTHFIIETFSPEEIAQKVFGLKYATPRG